MIADHQAFDNKASSESEKLFDLALLFEIDDNEYVAQILAIFLRDAPKELQQIKDAAKANNLKLAGSAAHKLKGSAGIIAATELIVLLEEIEMISMTENNNSQMLLKINAATAAFNRLHPPLHSVLTTLQ